jgi:hypothetical protein
MLSSTGQSSNKGNCPTVAVNNKLAKESTPILDGMLQLRIKEYFDGLLLSLHSADLGQVGKMKCRSPCKTRLCEQNRMWPVA